MSKPSAQKMNAKLQIVVIVIRHMANRGVTHNRFGGALLAKFG